MLKYGGVEYRSLEEQVRKNMGDISELDAGLTALSQKGGGGEAVEIGITLPDTATNGTITAEELSKLQESNSNYIIFKKEIYLLMDKQSNEGYITYSNVGVDSSMKTVVKTITITLSTMTWAMIETPIETGGSGADKSSRHGIATVNSKGQREILVGSWEGVYAKRLTIQQPSAAAITKIGLVGMENGQDKDFYYTIDNQAEGVYFSLQIVITKEGYPEYAFPMFKIINPSEVATGISVSPSSYSGIENVQKLFIVEQSAGQDNSQATYEVEDLYE